MVKLLLPNLLCFFLRNLDSRFNISIRNATMGEGEAFEEFIVSVESTYLLAGCKRLEISFASLSHLGVIMHEIAQLGFLFAAKE
jgi:hypothetical protein